MSTASATATYVIASALSVKAATDRAAYTRNQTAMISAVVTAAGIPVANASVSFLITKPNGTTTSGSATTDASGAALFKLRFKRQDPPGQYQVKAKVTATPALIGEASTSFAVQ